MFYTEITRTVHMIAVATSESDGDNLPLSCYKFCSYVSYLLRLRLRLRLHHHHLNLLILNIIYY